MRRLLVLLSSCWMNWQEKEACIFFLLLYLNYDDSMNNFIHGLAHSPDAPFFCGEKNKPWLEELPMIRFGWPDEMNAGCSRAVGWGEIEWPQIDHSWVQAPTRALSSSPASLFFFFPALAAMGSPFSLNTSPRCRWPPTRHAMLSRDFEAAKI